MTRSFRRTGLRRIGVLGACTAAAVSFTAVAPARAASPAQAADGFEFTLYAKEVPGDGASPSGQTPKVGDVFTSADDLYRTKGGDKVGRDGVTCAVVRVSGDQADANCVGTFVLNGGPGGQLAAQALVTFDVSNQAPAAYDIAVTGGTGDFKQARGYVRATPDGDYQQMQFHITTR
ncbi:allene oxide cyclase barrel-like domain-containing protein [Streptomyces sp. NPDC057540]|uniref:allene oxide cyclase barrel-like domain-containing protein n=1 Tax=Streptomyces sp. NPDC057540 TaxID=3346160 RepID=UPI0036C00F5D